MEAAIHLYLDENLSPKITNQLKLRGIDAVSARDLGTLGDSDESHLARATRMGRVLVTSDVDFLRFAGIRQMVALFNGTELPLQNETLQTGGLYAWMRHPLYFFLVPIAQ